LFRESSLRSAQVRHSYTKIYANWEGGDDGRYVGERFVDSGAMLNANHPILTVVEIKRLKAEIHVIERDYPLLRVGQVAEISTDAYPGQRFKGTIYRISKVLDEQSRQAEVQIEVDNANLKLKPGMYVRVAIEFGRSAGAQVLPKDALVKRDGKTGVFRVSHELKKAFFTPVETGIAEGGEIEISAPVLSEPVAVLGQHLLSHGSVIRETEEAKAQNGGKRK
jgi:RND family efflux transporter MFP subunit